MDTSSFNNTPGFTEGLKVRTEVLGEEYVGPSIEKGAADSFTHKLQQFVTEYCWGTVWCSEGLDRKTRSTINPRSPRRRRSRRGIASTCSRGH